MKYEQFFDTINHLLSIAKEKDRQASMRGENYNVFDIIGLTTNEVKLHSAFIADLLDPNGLHGLGIKPLKTFLDLLKLQLSEDDLCDAEVIKEYHIGNISDDYCWGGNIDILIKIKDYFLAIENKINAGDRRKQLLRYKNHIKGHLHSLLYLTLDGHEPKEYSAFGLENSKDYLCISYGVEILKWLHEILISSISHPLVRETIQQYIKTIKKLTNQEMKEIDRTELFNVMDKNPDVVREIVSNEWNYRRYLVETYILIPLKDYFKGKGFEWYESADFRNQPKDSCFGIFQPNWGKRIMVMFNNIKYDKAYYGICDPRERGSDVKPLLGAENRQAWPYGFKYLDKYTTWNIFIAEEIISGKVYRYVIEIFENLYKQICEKPELYPMD